jgi:cephalosporin hydroxylase
LRIWNKDPLDPETKRQVDRVIGDGNAVVILGACSDRATTARQFETYADLVGVGSYVVVTDTVVNGRPVWPSFGPGPFEGVKQILNLHGEFVPDPGMEKYSLSFNPGGFLLRAK